MKFLTGVLGLALTAFLNNAQAIPLGYEFYQDGFSHGGSISGTFIGEDKDGNGQLSSFLGEISDFHLTYSGGGLIPSFELGLDDLFGLVYDLGGTVLGDGLDKHIEGILAWNHDVVYGVGAGPLWSSCDGDQYCSLVGNREWINFSRQGVQVSVPEPGTYALILLGVAGLVLTRRRQSQK